MDQESARAYLAEYIETTEEDLVPEEGDGDGYSFRRLSSGGHYTVMPPIGVNDERPVVVVH